MKKFSLRSITFLSIILLALFFNSCKKPIINDEVDLDPGNILPTIYLNDGPLATVTNICGVLSFDDEAHFESVYQHLENRYNNNEDRDSTASLDAFQNSFNYTSRRKYVDDWEKGMENQGIPINDSNDIDTLFFGDLVMQTLINTKGIVKIGNDAVLILDDCLWIRVPFNDCQGKMLLEQLFDKLQEKGETADEAATEFLVTNDMIIDNRCSSISERNGCGFRVGFSYQDPVLNPATNFFEILLEDETSDDYTNSKMRIWKLKNNNLSSPAVFLPFSGGVSPFAFGRNVTLRVPMTMDKITVVLTKRTLSPYCEEEVEKIIYINCPHPDWRHIGDDKIQFRTRNSQPGMQVVWNFGDDLNTTSTALNPLFDYNVTCPELVNISFAITSPLANCDQEFYINDIPVGPVGFLRHKKGSGWIENGSEKFKWSLKVNGTPNALGLPLGNSKVKGFIKFKRRNNNGKWRSRKTNLIIRFEGNTYDTSCSILNNLASVSSARSRSNKKRMKHKYTTSTPFRVFVGDPIRAYFEAGGVSGTFSVFD